MSLKDSLEKVKTSKEGLKKEMQATRQMVKDIRPKPLRTMIDRKMGDIRPFRRIRKRFSEANEQSYEPSKTEE